MKKRDEIAFEGCYSTISIFHNILPITSIGDEYGGSRDAVFAFTLSNEPFVFTPSIYNTTNVYVIYRNSRITAFKTSPATNSTDLLLQRPALQMINETYRQGFICSIERRGYI